MPDPIRLEACPSCGVAVPSESPRCPECGAVRAGRGQRGPENPFDAFESIFGAQPPTRRGILGPLARSFLGRNLGCLIPLLAIVFGLPILVGTLSGNPMGTLQVMLLVVGIAGLGLTGRLVWLVRPPRRPRGDDRR